jgi:hypothetical protein
MLGNAIGVVANSDLAVTTTVIVSDSVISGGSSGVQALTGLAGANTQATVTRCTIEGTTVALDSETNNLGAALLTVSGSTITGNNSGWFQNGTGSTIKSLGNNHIQDNAGNVGTLTTAALQ